MDQERLCSKAGQNVSITKRVVTIEIDKCEHYNLHCKHIEDSE